MVYVINGFSFLHLFKGNHIKGFAHLNIEGEEEDIKRCKSVIFLVLQNYLTLFTWNFKIDMSSDIIVYTVFNKKKSS